VSWTPDKSLAKGTYTATVEWNVGPFGKLKADTPVKVGEPGRVGVRF
jgi:hypothetical protein